MTLTRYIKRQEEQNVTVTHPINLRKWIAGKELEGIVRKANIT